MNSNNATLLKNIGMLVVLCILGIGLFASPHDTAGRPLLLLPDVKAVEDYRQKAIGWDSELRLLDGEIAAVLSGDTTDLLGQSRLAQNTFEHSLRIAQEIDQQDSPPALSGLREEMKATSSSYLETARFALRWISISNQENLDQVQQQLTEARDDLARLEDSQWMKK